MIPLARDQPHAKQATSPALNHKCCFRSIFVQGIKDPSLGVSHQHNICVKTIWIQLSKRDIQEYTQIELIQTFSV